MCCLMLCVSCKRVVIAYGKIFSELSILTHTKGNDCTADDCPPLLIFWCNTSYQQVVGQCFSLFPISSKNSFLCYIFNTIGLISFFFSPPIFLSSGWSSHCVSQTQDVYCTCSARFRRIAQWSWRKSQHRHVHSKHPKLYAASCCVG